MGFPLTAALLAATLTPTAPAAQEPDALQVVEEEPAEGESTRDLPGDFFSLVPS